MGKIETQIDAAAKLALHLTIEAGSDAFSKLDADGSGTISREEFAKALSFGLQA